MSALAALSCNQEAKRVAEVVAPFLAEAEHRAIGVVVVEGSNARYHVFGARAATGSTPLDVDTTFEIGSVSKVFAGLLLLDAARRGEVALDDPLIKHLPDWKLPTREGKGMTLRHAATHTTGLPWMPDNWLTTDNQAQRTRYTERLFRDYLAAHVLESVPGEKYVYGNQGTALLALALRQATATPYPELLHQRIFRPLGMTRSGYQDKVFKVDANMLEGYEEDGKKFVPRLDVSPMGPCCVIRSTLRDMGRFAAAALNPADALAPVFAEALKTQHLTDHPDGRWVAFGWERDPKRDVFRKNGQVAGYRADLVIQPARRRGMFVVVNSQQTNINQLSNALIEAVLSKGP